MDKLIVALDQGTSGCRVMAVDGQGRVVAQKRRILLPERQGALSAYGAGEPERCAHGLLDDLLGEIGAERVAALAVSSQRSTIVLWDKQTGELLAPVLTWEDGRAAEENAQNPLSQQEVHMVTGLYKTPYFSAPKIAWCLAHIPMVKAAAQEGRLAAAPVASYLIWKWTRGAVFATDATLAQRTLLFDIHTQTWSEKLCASFGIDPHILPAIYPSVFAYGNYDFKGVQIPITVCVGDQQAAAAYLPLEKGQSCLNYGTGAFLLHHIGSEAILLEGMLTSLGASCQPDSRNFLLEGPVNAAGSAFLWLAGQGIPFTMDNADALCAQAKKPVRILPALGGLGAPYWDYSLSPVITDLYPHTSAADWVAGMARGIAFLITDIAAYLKLNGIELSAEVAVSGGLCRLSYMMQQQADFLQRRLVMNTETESTLLGAARLAAAALGVDVGAWKKASARAFVPQVSPEQTALEYRGWCNFMERCRGKK